MVLTWMTYTALIAALTGLAALTGERVLRGVGRPARGIWSAATVGSLLIPVAAWMWADVAPRKGAGAAAVGVGEVVGAPAGEIPAGAAGAGWTATLSRLDRPAGWLWVATSGGLILLFTASALRLAAGRRRWGRAEVGGEVVRLSPDIGPAVVGLFRPEVVLPSWVGSSDEETRRWIVAHEREHVRAGDPMRVAASLLAAVLVPWNLPLWWQLRRLRQAVEIDCDERVLRGADPLGRRRYAALLLEVGRRSITPLPVHAAFAETSGTFLERRIRTMTSSPPPLTFGRALGAVALAAVLMVGACSLPGPDRRVSPMEPELPEEAAEGSARVESFTPYTRAPKLLNPAEVAAAVERGWPALLKDAGIGGTTTLYLFVDELGRVTDTRIHESSGHEQLDHAALRTVDAYRFTPALDVDEPVGVWIRMPVTFARATDPEMGLDVDHDAAEDPEPVGAPEPRNLAAQPTFTPYTVPPRLTNVDEVRAELDRAYPPLLRDAGITGTASVYFFVDETGVVRDTRLNQSSGHDQLDDAALRVARAMTFTAALNRDAPVPVWISLPITFMVR